MKTTKELFWELLEHALDYIIFPILVQLINQTGYITSTQGKVVKDIIDGDLLCQIEFKNNLDELWR